MDHAGVNYNLTKISCSTNSWTQDVEAEQINDGVDDAIQLIKIDAATAFTILMTFAEENHDPIAQNVVGDMYFCGIGTEQNFALAAERYERAAKNGNAASSNNLGYAAQYGLKEGKKFKSQPQEAMTHYVQALITTARANKGDIDNLENILQNLMGGEEFAVAIYDSGEHMTPHTYFLQVARTLEYSDLLTAFAIVKNACLLKGKKLEAFEIQTLNELQEKIFESAQRDLDDEDYLSAYKKFFFLAKDNHVTPENQQAALRMLGQMYFKGWGVTQNLQQAIMYLNIPAKQGDKKACLLLGEIYSGNTDHFDHELAIYWYQQAGGISDNKLRLYNAVLKDLQTKEKYQSGIEKLEFLAKQGCAEAQYKLGEINLKSGVQCQSQREGFRYFELAFQYFNEATKNRYGPAYFMAGQALEKMGGSPLSPPVLAFYEQACSSYDPAVNHRGQAHFVMAMNLSQSDKDEDKKKLIAENDRLAGKSYLDGALLLGCSKALDAMFRLGEKFLKQYENAEQSKKNELDLAVGTYLSKLALDYKSPLAIKKKQDLEKLEIEQKENHKKLQIEKEQKEKEQKAAQEKLQREKEQKQKEWNDMVDSVSSAFSGAWSAFADALTPDPNKTLKIPTIFNRESSDDESENEKL